MSRRRRRGHESSTGRLAHPPHSMRVVEACSAAAAREAAFVRPHCRPHITEVHSAAACAASAQSPSAALNGYDGTAPFHHTAYAASYTARSATRQATASYAASYALAPFQQDRAWLCRMEDSHGQSKEIQEQGLHRLQRYNVCTVCYFILHHWAHLSGTQRLCTLLP